MSKTHRNSWRIISLIVSFFCLLCLNGYSYSIKARVTGLKDSTCYLGFYYGKTQYTAVDTAKADAMGNLYFAKNRPLKQGVYLILIPGSFFEIIIGEEQDIKIETDTSQLIYKMKTKGSLDNEIFYNFQKIMIDKTNEARKYVELQRSTMTQDSVQYYKDKLKGLQVYMKEYRANIYKKYPTTLTAKLLKAAQEPEVPEFRTASGTIDTLKSSRYYKEHFFDNIDFSDERMLRTPIFIPRIDKYMKEWTVQIPDSINKSADILIKKAEANKDIFKYCVSTITNRYETSDIIGMDAVFVHMAETYYLNGKCFWIDTATERKIRDRVTIIKPLLIGKVFPPTYYADTTGKYISIHDIKAKYSVVIFWSSDCGHCQKEVPKLFTLYNEKLKDRGVAVYAVSIERKPTNWTKFINDKKITAPGWYNVWDYYTRVDYTKIFDVTSTPVLYILDKDKKIIGKKLVVDQIEEFLQHHEKVMIK